MKEFPISGDQTAREDDAAHAALKSKLKRAAAQAEAGAVVDGEKFIDELLLRLSEKSKES